jgi:hypothetical protein
MFTSKNIRVKNKPIIEKIVKKHGKPLGGRHWKKNKTKRTGISNIKVPVMASFLEILFILYKSETPQMANIVIIDPAISKIKTKAVVT